MTNRIPLSSPNIDQKDIDSVASALSSNFLSAGPQINLFEEKIAAYIGVKEVVAVSSATTGIELALASIPNLNPGDEVLVPAFTFPACINSVLARRLRPRLIDINMDTLNLDVDQLKKRVTRKTKAIIPVDAFGVPCEMEGIEEFCISRGLQIVRDSATALGAKSATKNVGNDEFATIFSFHQRKIITTGEGGCVTTNDTKLANRLRLLRSHGASRGEFFAVFESPGFNFRMSEMQAALGVSQMDKLNGNIQQHSKIAAKYRDLLTEIPEIDLSSSQNFDGRIMQSFIIRVNSLEIRNSLIAFLRQLDIESTLGTYDLSSQPAYSKYVKWHRFPNARKAGETTIALPIFASLTDDQISHVCESIKSFFHMR